MGIALSGTLGTRWGTCQVVRQKHVMSTYCMNWHASGDQREKQSCQIRVQWMTKDMYRFVFSSVCLKRRLKFLLYSNIILTSISACRDNAMSGIITCSNTSIEAQIKK